MVFFLLIVFFLYQVYNIQLLIKDQGFMKHPLPYNIVIKKLSCFQPIYFIEVLSKDFILIILIDFQVILTIVLFYHYRKNFQSLPQFIIITAIIVINKIFNDCNNNCLKLFIVKINILDNILSRKWNIGFHTYFIK